MHRRALLDLLARYRALRPDEAGMVARLTTFVEGHPDCFLRSCAPGHITGAAWIHSPDHRRFLLTHHRKLGRWLQLGGHADGESQVAEVAFREAREESGMDAFDLIDAGGKGLPIDVDVHEIPERPGEPAHLHYDIRFLLVARPGQRIEVSEESHDVRWFDYASAEAVLAEESLVRMARKAREAADRFLR